MSSRVEIIDLVDDAELEEPFSRTVSPEPGFAGGAAGAPPGARCDSSPTVRTLSRKIRLRGMYMAFVEQFYPRANLKIHRVGDNDVARDIEMQDGNTDRPIPSVIDHNASYRVVMTGCGVATGTYVGWCNELFPEEGYTGEEFANVFKLGEDFEDMGQMAMFTIYTKDVHTWVVARQIPGKAYTRKQCMDLLKVPAQYRLDMHGFGPKVWINGNNIPEVWISKGLSVPQVTSKIFNIMRT